MTRAARRAVIETELRWEHERALSVVTSLLHEGMLWADSQAPEMLYWLPSVLGDD